MKSKYKLKSNEELHPVVRNLIGIAKNGEKEVDADKAQMEFFLNFYGQYKIKCVYLQVRIQNRYRL